MNPSLRMSQKLIVPRWAFIALLILTFNRSGIPAQSEKSCGIEIEEATIAVIHTAMKSGKCTAQGLVQAYMKRIDLYDKQGPGINAILEINPDAVKIAEALDAEYKLKGFRGPLHGIPVIVKDNIQTADRMTTTAGSLTFHGWIAPKDAYIVRKLREAGAIILAKANMQEFARGTTTISSQGGQTRNPYALDRHPSGSSGGTGAAIAANFGAVGIGTDTGSSIRGPSTHNSLVGIRSTMGLVSRAGVIPSAPTQDIVGPMTRTVADAAVVLDVIAGYDSDDPVTAESVGKIPKSYTEFLQVDGLKGARLGLVRELFAARTSSSEPPPDAEELEEVTSVINVAIEEMKRLGAEIVDPVKIPTMDKVRSAESRISWEFKASLNDYLAKLGPDAPVKSLAGIIATGLVTPDVQERLFLSQEKESLDSPKYLRGAWDSYFLSRQGILVAMADHNLDVLVYPSSLRPVGKIRPPGKGEEPSAGGGNSTLSSVSGFPSIVVPVGFTRGGLPVGIELLGRPYSEPTLIKLAYAFEHGSSFGRRPPPSWPNSK